MLEPERCKRLERGLRCAGAPMSRSFRGAGSLHALSKGFDENSRSLVLRTSQQDGSKLTNGSLSPSTLAQRCCTVAGGRAGHPCGASPPSSPAVPYSQSLADVPVPRPLCVGTRTLAILSSCSLATMLLLLTRPASFHVHRLHSDVPVKRTNYPLISSMLTPVHVRCRALRSIRQSRTLLSFLTQYVHTPRPATPEPEHHARRARRCSGVQTYMVYTIP